MTLLQVFVTAFAVLTIGVMMPFSYAVRMGLFVALVATLALAIVSGGMEYLLSLFD